MRKTTLFVMAVLLPLAACAQLLTRNYQHQSLPEVLIDIDNASPELQISFIYDKLEDYTVTCSFTDVSPIEAIHCAVGFYPVKINRNNNLITIEPIYDTGQSLKGRLVSERGEGVEFADISVFTLPDTSYVASAISTEGGDFVIPLEREGDLWMKVRRMGYLPLSRPVKMGNVGNIFMHSDATRLKEIEVYAQSVQPTKYGIVAIPNKEGQRRSSDAWMLMDRMMIPGLQIDVLNRKVTAANSQQVSYFINGVHAESWEVVALSPQRISHIEFLASPPDPQYNNARWVLNFVLKEPDYGGYAMMEAEQGIVYHMGSIDVATKINRGRMTYLAMAAADYSNDNAISIDAEKEYRYAPDSVVVKVSNTKEWVDKQNYTGAFVARYDSKNVMLQGSAGFKYRRVSKDHSEIGNNYLYNGQTAHADAISDASGESYAPYIRLAWQFSNLPHKATLTGSASLTYNRNSAYNLYTVKEIPEPLQNDSKESAWIPFMALAYQVPVFGKNSLKLSADFSSERYNIDYIGTAQSHQRLINNDLNISVRYNHIFSDSWRGSFLVGVPVKAYKVNEQKFNTRAYFNAYLSLNGNIGRKHSFSGFAQIQQMTLQPEFYNTVIRQDDEMEGSQGAPNLKVPRFLSANFAHTWMASNLFSLSSSIGTYGVLDDLVPDFRPSNGLMIRTMVNSGDYYTLFATINPSLSLCNRKLRLNLYSYFAYEHHTGIYSLSLRNAVFQPSVAWDVSRHLSLSTQFSTSIGKAYMRGGTGANVARNFGSLVVVGSYSAGNLLLSARLNWSLRKSNGWEYWLDHSYLQEHYYSSRPSNNRFLLLTARYTFDFGRKMNHEEKASFEGTAKTAVLSR